MAAPTRRSLVNIRRKLARHPKLTSLTLVTTDGTPADGTSIIASDLAGGLDANAYRECWVMPTQTGATDPGASARKLRRCGEQALNTSTGQLATTVAYPAIVASGVDVEIHKELPPVDHDGQTGLLSCINLALSEMWLPQRLPLIGVAGQPTYDLSAYSDWLDPDAIVEVYGPASDSTQVPMPWPGFDPLANADQLSLQVAPTFNTGDSIQMGITRPGDTWIKVAGTWAASTTGLLNDTDECLFQPDFLVEIALVHVFDALATSGDKTDYWTKKAEQQRVVANLLKLRYLTHIQRRPTHPLGPYSAMDPKADFLGSL